MKVNLQGKQSVTVISAYAQHLVLGMKKCNSFMITLTEQWLIATPNIRSVQEIIIQKLELKEEDIKSMGAFVIGERNERGTQLIIANMFQKLKIYTGLGSPPVEKQETKQSLH